MIDALVGAILAVTATTAVLLAVQVTEASFTEAGRTPPLEAELEILRSAGYSVELGSQPRLELESTLGQLSME